MLLSLGLLCYSKAWSPCHVPAPTVHLSLFTLGGVSGKGDASDEDDDNEFFDAMEDPAEFITVPADPKYHRFITPCFSNFIFKSCVVFIALVILVIIVLKCMPSCLSVHQEIWEQRQRVQQ